MTTEPRDLPEPGTAATAPVPPAAPSFATLISGIVTDLQSLLKQHLSFFRQEVLEDFRKTKEAARSVAWAFGLGLAGTGLLLAMSIGLLAWAMPAVPWWGWCGILGSTLLLAAAVLYQAGKRNFKSFNPLPDESAQTMKESVEWMANQATPDRK